MDRRVREQLNGLRERVQSLEKDLHTTMVKLRDLKMLSSPKVDHFSLARDVQANAQDITILTQQVDRMETILDDVCTRLETRGI